MKLPTEDFVSAQMSEEVNEKISSEKGRICLRCIMIDTICRRRGGGESMTRNRRDVDLIVVKSSVQIPPHPFTTLKAQFIISYATINELPTISSRLFYFYQWAFECRGEGTNSIWGSIKWPASIEHQIRRKATDCEPLRTTAWKGNKQEYE